jgi:hypothetical protein
MVFNLYVKCIEYEFAFSILHTPRYTETLGGVLHDLEQQQSGVMVERMLFQEILRFNLGLEIAWPFLFSVMFLSCSRKMLE